VSNLLLTNKRSLKKVGDSPGRNTVRTSFGYETFNPLIVNIIAEAGENFFRYLKNIGLAKEPNLIVLSSKHHYYCDEDELKRVRTLINLKKLNLIKHLDVFLFTLFHVLPHEVNFIGCFSDSRTMNPGLLSSCRPSRLISKLVNLFESDKNQDMDKNKVTEILNRNGFIIVNMTEINGLTYFCSQKISRQIDLIA
jgi:hypothetical protein